jgi:SAM-dependent methyltransferase
MLRLEQIPCPLCGSDATIRVATGVDNLSGIPGEFHIDRCRNCNHRFMNPRPILSDLSACYPETYGPHRPNPDGLPADSNVVAQSESATRKPWYLRYLPLKYIPGLKRFYDWLLDDRSQPVPAAPSEGSLEGLEIGCATGCYLQALQHQGWNVAGVEPGEAPAERARQAGLDVYNGVLDTYEFAPESFGLVAAWMVLEHVPDPRTTLTQMHSALEPGGQLLLSIPNAGCWEPLVFGRHWYVWELPRHLHHFAPASIRRLLAESNFEQIEIIHQRTMLNVVGSLGIWFRNRRSDSRIGTWLLSVPDEPLLWMQLLLAPLAHLLAVFRQGGRLTIRATKTGATQPPVSPSDGHVS